MAYEDLFNVIEVIRMKLISKYHKNSWASNFNIKTVRELVKLADISS